MHRSELYVRLKKAISSKPVTMKQLALKVGLASKVESVSPATRAKLLRQLNYLIADGHVRRVGARATSMYTTLERVPPLPKKDGRTRAYTRRKKLIQLSREWRKEQGHTEAPVHFEVPRARTTTRNTSVSPSHERSCAQLRQLLPAPRNDFATFDSVEHYYTLDTYRYD